MERVQHISIKHTGEAWVSRTVIPYSETVSRTKYVLEYKPAGGNCVDMLKWGDSPEEVISWARSAGL